MINHTVDSWEVRQLVERYASGADRGDGEGVASLFTEDGEFVLWLDPDSPDPTSHRRGRAEIAQALRGLDRYRVTTHMLGQHVVHLDGDRATGETYCMAHHLSDVEGGVRDRVMSIRYLDRFVRAGGRWRIA